ncbi:MAG TPA: DUF2652 domain-containing protein [Parafilimonas sp.]|nr:DUF2652 domain-containing protein [Parafilimonas sp.]
MAESGLLFIPDISGFTKFVNETEIDHSRIIIEELLENIINSNKIGLHISEVEGDAILFYRFGGNPSFEELSSQVEKMFCNFQKQIKYYENTRMCTCAACTSAVKLSLKIITHYGEFSSYTVKDFSKLIGKDVIVAHQLLKNDIDLHEYWLATNNLFPAENKTEQLPEWLQWKHGTKQTENGNISFDYSLLTSLKENIEPDLPIDRTLGENKIKVASATKTINAEIISVFSMMGNLPLRNKWQAGVKSIDKINHPIYHLGIRFRAITNKGSTVFYSSSFNDADNMFCLSETDENKTQSIYITLKPTAENKTSVTLDLYLPHKPLNGFIFSLFMKRKMEKNFKQSLNNLERLLTGN